MKEKSFVVMDKSNWFGLKINDGTSLSFSPLLLITLPFCESFKKDRMLSGIPLFCSGLMVLDE